MTRQKPRWFLFGLVQVFCIASFNFSVKFFFSGNVLAWLFFISGCVFLSFSMAYFWPEIKEVYLAGQEDEKNLKKQDYSLLWLKALGLCVVFVFILFFIKLLFSYWVLNVFFQSLISSVMLSVLLFVVLYDVGLYGSFLGAVMLWKHRVQLPAIFCFLLMVCNSLALYFSKTLFLSQRSEGFSEFFVSANILLLAVVVLVFSLYFTVWLNCFLVIGFLKNVKPISKDKKFLENQEILYPTR